MIYNMVLSQCTSMTISVLSHLTTTSAVKVSSTSCFSANNPITLPPYIITSSQLLQVQRTLTAMASNLHPSQTRLACTCLHMKKYTKVLKSIKKLTNLILFNKRQDFDCSAPSFTIRILRLSCSPRYPQRIAYFSHSLHLSEKDLLNFISMFCMVIPYMSFHL